MGVSGTDLASLSLKFCERSAANDAAGEEPRTPLRLKYSALRSWNVNWPLSRGLGTRCGPNRLGWPKAEGAAGRMAASGDEVSMTPQGAGACAEKVAACYWYVWVLAYARRLGERRSASRVLLSACSTGTLPVGRRLGLGCLRGREGRAAQGVTASSCRSAFHRAAGQVGSN